MRLSATIIAAALAVAAPAWAQPAADEAPVSTARAGSNALSTQAQIDQYLADSPPIGVPADRSRGQDLVADGADGIHGEVSVSVGTGGYRSGHVAAVIPLGERGTLALRYGQTDFGDNGGGYGYGYGRPLSPSGFGQRRGPLSTACAADGRDSGFGRIGDTSERCPVY